MRIPEHRFHGSDGPTLLILAGVHGDEFEPIAAVRRLAERFESNTAVRNDLRGTLVLVPCLNEPAFWLGRRCGHDGLDLARTFPGKADGSDTERIAHAATSLLRNADFLIDLHTGGTEFSIYPLAGYVLHNVLETRAVQQRMAEAFGLPVIWGTAANLDGRTLSEARDANVPAIYCEYGGGGRCDLSAADSYVQGCLAVMREVGMLPSDSNDKIDAKNWRYWVEDATPDSGHLQIQNGSPCDGFFEPTVALGDLIEQGQPLGRVFPLAGGVPLETLATHSGVVLVLRTFPRVLKGESVGVVLDTSKARVP